MSDDLIIGLTFLAPTLVLSLVVLFRSHRRHNRRYRFDRIDVTRCERAGSQDEFMRRLRSGGVR